MGKLYCTHCNKLVLKCHDHRWVFTVNEGSIDTNMVLCVQCASNYINGKLKLNQSKFKRVIFKKNDKI